MEKGDRKLSKEAEESAFPSLDSSSQTKKKGKVKKLGQKNTSGKVISNEERKL